MKDTDLMPFGKYKGKPMSDVPASYLIWLRDDAKAKGSRISDPRVAEYIKNNWTCLLSECPDYIED